MKDSALNGLAWKTGLGRLFHALHCVGICAQYNSIEQPSTFCILVQAFYIGKFQYRHMS